VTAHREDNLLGRLALHYKLLTREQLVDSLQQQAREGHRRKIGDIWVENLWMTPQRFAQLLQAQREYESRLAAQAAASASPVAGAPDGPAATGPSAPPARAGGPPAAPLGELTAGPPPGAELLGGGHPGLARPELADAAPASTVPVLPTLAAGGSVARSAGAPAAVAPGPAPQPPVAPQPPPAPQPAAAPAAAPSAATGMARLLAYAVQRGASDLHLHAGLPVRLRVHGDFRAVEERPLPPEQTRRLIQEILQPEQQQALEEHGQVDFAYTLAGVGRFRANVYRQRRGVDGVFRVIPAEPPTLSDLGLPLDLARFANFHQGLVLITGPTGSGKSSTLAALVRIVNEERRDHVITIEDPVEMVHRPLQCVVNQRQVGLHTRSFSRALRAALREDPDVIVVGELRDLETISLALTAAETGHLVLATLHTQNAVNTINRLIGVFPPEQQSQIRTMLSESLRAITSQRLAVRADGNGRVAALEVLVASKAVSNLIRENKTFQLRSVMQTGGSQGMRFLDQSLEELVRAGTITREEAARHAEDPKRFGRPG
jgi:twitching motility protein PilT